MAAFQWQPASQPLPDRQECTTVAQTSFTFSPITSEQEDFLALLGTRFVSLHQAEGLLKLVRQPTEQKRDIAGVSSNRRYSTPPPHRHSPGSILCCQVVLKPCRLAFLHFQPSALQLHNQSKGAGITQQGTSSRALASASAELITCSRLWKLCHC